MLSRPPTRGLSLVELMIVLAVLGVAAGALSRIATRQQKTYRALALRTLALTQLREGGEVLAAELAGLAPGAGDIYEGEMADASIGFRASFGTYLLCARPAEGTSRIDVIRFRATGTPDPSQADADDGDLPAAGDSLWIHESGREIAGAGDRWSAHLITGAGEGRGPCGPALDSGSVAVARLTIAPVLARPIAAYAPVRVFRRARFALYRSSDGAWYLGFRDCRPVVRNPPCAPLQPVSGPYLGHSPARALRPSGLTLGYLDRNGVPTDDRLAVAAIEIVLRAAAPATDGSPDTSVSRHVVALRNAPP